MALWRTAQQVDGRWEEAVHGPVLIFSFVGRSVRTTSNARNTVLYVGVTNNIERRVAEHKGHGDPRSFTTRYNVDKLACYEAHESITAAIAREKRLKNWKREWKDALISEVDPEWKDLAATGMCG